MNSEDYDKIAASATALCTSLRLFLDDISMNLRNQKAKDASRLYYLLHDMEALETLYWGKGVNP